MENLNATEIVEQAEIRAKEIQAVNFRLTSTGRPTLVGTRQCSECGRHEFHTKKFEKSGDPEDLNQRYTLCKGVCVYCYAQKRNKKSGTSLSENELKAKIQFYTELLVKKTAETEVK